MIRGQFAVGRYIQGPGALSRCGEFMPVKRGKVLFLADEIVMGLTHDQFASSVADAGLCAVPCLFGGECSEEEIHRVRERAVSSDVALIAGAGGGKCIDTARMVSHFLELPLVSIPTIAATNSATSSLAAVYSEDHSYRYAVKVGRTPELAVVDTRIIAQAPVRFLVAGMGDALCPKYEGRAMQLSGKLTVHGTRPSDTALAISEMAHEIILEKGSLAMMSVQHKRVTPALEDTVEAILFLSELGAEGGGGTAVGHGLHAAFTVLPELKAVYHGERAVFGLIVQLILEDRPLWEISRIQDFCVEVGLPVTLAQLRITNGVEEALGKVVRKACEPGGYVHNMPFPVTEESLTGAIHAADALGRKALARSNGSTSERGWRDS
ncbi:MAG: glycerol dehydrogenase [Firmicutes bacterium]|jgi:glycerol dehydrogenase|nr:glycerol dehydrogenase [Bacillota bacterium]